MERIANRIQDSFKLGLVSIFMFCFSFNFKSTSRPKCPYVEWVIVRMTEMSGYLAYGSVIVRINKKSIGHLTGATIFIRTFQFFYRTMTEDLALNSSLCYVHGSLDRVVVVLLSLWQIILALYYNLKYSVPT